MVTDMGDSECLIKLCSIFQDAQKSVSSHRKLVVILLKVQQECDEGQFSRCFLRILYAILPVKKGEPCGDRAVQFCDAFFKYFQMQHGKIATEDIEETDEEDETPYSRFSEFIVRSLLQGIQSKHKVVRFRVCQLISVLMNGLEEIDDELFQLLKTRLSARLKDKETSIRVQATLALSRLQGDGNPSSQGGEEDDEDQDSVAQLVDVLRNDPSSEVRRAAMFNLTQTAHTLPYLLERARDIAPLNRRSVYTRIMKQVGDFRVLPINIRTKLLNWGLRDRDHSVKAAASKMVGLGWVNTVDNNILELLERIDVMNSGVADIVMETFFECRPDAVDKINFETSFWECITVESVFLARSFNDFRYSTPQREQSVKDAMPDISQLSHYINGYMEQLANSSKTKRAEIGFIVQQLLLIARKMDYGDEVGRRIMLNTLRSKLPCTYIPSLLVGEMVQVIVKMYTSQVDLIRMVAETIADIQDLIEEASERRQSSSEDSGEGIAHYSTLLGLRCLELVCEVLKITSEQLQDDSNLVSMLNNMIVPAVRSHESIIREKGLECLGLCCLLDRDLAAENLMLFGHCYVRGHEALQLEALKVIADILAVHGKAVFEGSASVDMTSIVQLFHKALRTEDSLSVQAASAEAICKLIAIGVLNDAQLLKTLIIAYFHPETVGNTRLRQILSVGIPLMCYASEENQRLMQQVGVSALKSLVQYYDEYDDEEQTLSPVRIGSQIIEWIDPRIVPTTQEEDQEGLIARDSMAHIYFGIDLLKAVHRATDKGQKKIYCSLLSKLYIPTKPDSEHIDLEKMMVANEMAKELLERNNIKEAMPKSTLARFQTSLEKAIANNPAVIIKQEKAEENMDC